MENPLKCNTFLGLSLQFTIFEITLKLFVYLDFDLQCVDQLKLVSVCMDPRCVKSELWREYSFLSFIGTQSVVVRRPAFRKGAQTFVA